MARKRTLPAVGEATGPDRPAVGTPGINWAFELIREVVNETLTPGRCQYAARGAIGVVRGWLPQPVGWWRQVVCEVGGVALDYAEGKSAVIGKALSDLGMTWALRQLDGRDAARTPVPSAPDDHQAKELAADLKAQEAGGDGDGDTLLSHPLPAGPGGGR